MASIDDVLSRIDDVITRNRRIEWTYIFLTVLLFLTGIACFVIALITGQFAWSTPSLITTAMLYKPLNEIKEIRQKNIALAIVPMLTELLPTDKATEEIQKLLQSLYRGDN